MYTVEEILMMVNKEEGFDVEFKESVSGLKSEDLVAFANSKSGGTILIGVKDEKQHDGRQIGKIVGCTISDADKLSILNKAQSCRPPVVAEISCETIDSLNLYIVKVPSGDFKPYCTEGGTYRIRGDAQKKALYPNELLSLFMESERDKFISKFQEATQVLEKDLLETRKQLLEEMTKIIHTFTMFENNISSSLNDITSTVDDAESNTGSIESTVDNIEDTVDDIWFLLGSTMFLLPRIDTKLKENITQQENGYRYITEILTRYIQNAKRNRGTLNPRMIERQISVLVRIFPEIEKEEIKMLFNQLKFSQ